MRNTKTVSVWPIALVKDIVYQAPICSNDKVIFIHILNRNIIKCMK